MYDYKKDDGQLSEKNKKGNFAGGGNISSDFKLQKESLPQWAVDWARDRFNMDAQNVKFYVMDEQEADEPYAAASGNSIFVTSDQRNDETVIKHELTHIYQQAIGTATESNAGDTSLEDEAVRVSEKKKFSLAKNQTQSDRYILPREKTNLVQYKMSALAIAGLVVGGILTLGILPLGIWIAKQIGYKKIAKNTGIQDVKTVKEIYDIFSWAEDEEDYLEDVEDLCSFKKKYNISLIQFREDSERYKEKFGKPGMSASRLISSYFDYLYSKFDPINTGNNISMSEASNSEYSTAESSIAETVNSESSRTESIGSDNKLKNLTNDFKNRSFGLIEKDMEILFGKSLANISSEEMEEYCKLYRSEGFSELTPEILEDYKKKILGEGKNSIEFYCLYRNLLFKTSFFKSIGIEEFIHKREKLAELFHLKIYSDYEVYLNNLMLTVVPPFKEANDKELAFTAIQLDEFIKDASELIDAGRLKECTDDEDVVNDICIGVARKRKSSEKAEPVNKATQAEKLDASSKSKQVITDKPLTNIMKNTTKKLIIGERQEEESKRTQELINNAVEGFTYLKPMPVTFNRSMKTPSTQSVNTRTLGIKSVQKSTNKAPLEGQIIASKAKVKPSRASIMEEQVPKPVFSEESEERLISTKPDVKPKVNPVINEVAAESPKTASSITSPEMIIFDIFAWSQNTSNGNSKGKDIFKNLYNVVNSKGIKLDILRMDSTFLEYIYLNKEIFANNSDEVIDAYIKFLKAGYKSVEGYFKLYIITNKFKDRSIDRINEDLMDLMLGDLYCCELYEINAYIELYDRWDKFSKLTCRDISQACMAIAGDISYVDLLEIKDKLNYFKESGIQIDEFNAIKKLFIKALNTDLYLELGLCLTDLPVDWFKNVFNGAGGLRMIINFNQFIEERSDAEKRMKASGQWEKGSIKKLITEFYSKEPFGRISMKGLDRLIKKCNEMANKRDKKSPNDMFINKSQPTDADAIKSCWAGITSYCTDKYFGLGEDEALSKENMPKDLGKLLEVTESFTKISVGKCEEILCEVYNRYIKSEGGKYMMDIFVSLFINRLLPETNCFRGIRADEASFMLFNLLEDGCETLVDKFKELQRLHMLPV